MGVATRNAIWVILLASVAVAVAGVVLWLDSKTVEVTGYSTGAGNKLAIAGLALATALIAWRMLTDANELAWGLLAVAAGATFSVAANANLAYEAPGCSEFYSYLSFLAVGCYSRSDTGAIVLWAITVAALTAGVLALSLPVIELWDRNRFRQKE
ncbi:MAG TPA: hypothetical protein VMT90_02165 [Dehalococcoidia bacterium]|nr:hypothetical protein [Dehalococcoidia bacterium]